jgi:uncharacterized membrane protein
MNIVLAMHIAAGLVAILTGAAAAAVRKGGAVHARAGTWFVASMLVLGVTASVLEPFRTPPGSPVSGIFVCYFTLTAWTAARRRDGRTGRFELVAGLFAIGIGALMAWGGLVGGSTTPAGRGPVFILAALSLLAGLGDLNAVRLKVLRPGQRISRHVWRICFAFFIATGSFFLGQQKVMPAEIRGSPILMVLAFAPFALMLFWLVRLRVAKGFRKAIQALGERRGVGEPGSAAI